MVGCDATHDPAGHSVHPRQTVAVVTDQDTMHRRWVHPEKTAEPGRAELAGFPQRHDPSLDPSGCLMRARLRPARAIDQPVDAVGLIAPPPLVRALTRD